MPLGKKQRKRKKRASMSVYNSKSSELELPEPNFADLELPEPNFGAMVPQGENYEGEGGGEAQDFDAQSLASFLPAQYSGPIGGAVSGLQAGIENAENDPNMSNKKDGFGTKYKDRRAEVGGTVLGTAMGYFGGPLGASLAGPAVSLIHPFAEKGTRELIKFGDSWGGSGGALLMDPIGTIASGKYNAMELLKGALLGPFSKLIK